MSLGSAKNLCIFVLKAVGLGTNDNIRSTIHRVRAPPGLSTEDGMTPERYSIPYVSPYIHFDVY